jgi:hypothetical protein
MDTNGDHGSIVVVVLYSHLGLSIRPRPWTGTILADLGETSTKLGTKYMAEGHHFRGLISCISKHVSLVTSTNHLRTLGEVAVDTLSNIRRLLLNVDKDLAVVSIEPYIIGHKTDTTASIPDNLLIVNIGFGSDLIKDHDHVGLSAGLTSNLAVRIFSKACIKYRIRYLVTELIRVSLIDGLRSEKWVQM